MTGTTNKVSINYGALADPLETQLNIQGYTLGNKKDFIYKLHSSLIMCSFHILTDAQYSSASKKLHKAVMDNIQILDA